MAAIREWLSEAKAVDTAVYGAVAGDRDAAARRRDATLSAAPPTTASSGSAPPAPGAARRRAAARRRPPRPGLAGDRLGRRQPGRQAADHAPPAGAAELEELAARHVPMPRRAPSPPVTPPRPSPSRPAPVRRSPASRRRCGRWRPWSATRASIPESTIPQMWSPGPFSASAPPSWPAGCSAAERAGLSALDGDGAAADQRRAGSGGRLGHRPCSSSAQLEAGGGQGRRGVAVAVAAVGEEAPGLLEPVLGAGRPGLLGADVLEKSSRPPGFSTRRSSASAAAGSGIVQRTRVATTAVEAGVRIGQPLGRDFGDLRPRPARRAEVASCARSRLAMCGSGSSRTSSLTAAG